MSKDGPDIDKKTEGSSVGTLERHGTIKFRGTNLELVKDAPRETSLEDKAGFFSKVFLFYLNPLFKLGSERLLEPEDLSGTSHFDQSNVLHESFTREWAKEREKPLKKISLMKTLIRAVGVWKLIWGVGLYGVYAASSFVPIIIQNALVKHFEGTEELSDTLLWIYVALLFVVPMVGSIGSAHNNVMTAHIGVRFRNTLIGAIYRKSLVLSPASRNKTSTGQIVNMFSNDTNQIQNLMMFIGMIVFSPAQIAVALALIYQQVGNATWVGLAFMIILFPVNGVIFGLMTKIRKEKVKVTDIRVKLMNEILNGIRIIKYYAWEDAFQTKISKIRDEEMVLLTRMAYVVAIGFSLILMSAPVVQPVLVFYTYIRLGNHLDAAKAFTTISLFNVMRFPFAFLPMGLAQWSQAKVSLKRMAEFLLSEELSNYVEKPPLVAVQSAHFGDTVVSMKDVSFSWVREEDLEEERKNKEKENEKLKGKNNKNKPEEKTVVTKSDTANKLGGKPAAEETQELDALHEKTAEEGTDLTPKLNRGLYTLVDLNIDVKRGQLVAVVGSVGSGKTSLLNGILGELNLVKGTVSTAGSIAYCDQRPWILNATLKDNVTFGLPYDEDKFLLALNSSALSDDIKILPGGVLTEIGERGINLSGGQKARVALARAVYRDADIYLLDDPLSAVDAHVGQHIFQDCIVDALTGKTRLLVTHHVHLLPSCDLVIVLHDGKIVISGTYDELRSSGLDLKTILPPKDTEEPEVVEEVSSQTDSTKDSSIVHDEESKEDFLAGGENRTGEEGKAAAAGVSEAEMATGTDRKREGSHMVKKLKAAKSSKDSLTASRKLLDSRSSTIMSQEERDKGDVDKGVYSYYVAAGGWCWYVILAIVMCTAAGLDVGSSFWLSFWSEQTLRRDLSSRDNIYYLDIYALICMLNVFLLTVRGLILAQHRLGTSLKLHNDLLVSILGAPVAFFDQTPLGRILNRFSSDILVVDETLSQTLSQLVNSLFSVLGAAAGIAAATKGTFLILLVPLYFIYDRVQKFFRKTNTEVQRLQSVSLSPVYADFSQALAGVGTIRAYSMIDRFILQMEDSVDRNTTAAVLQQLCGQWLAIRLDLLSALISLFIAALAAATGTSFIPAGYLALALTYSLSLTTYLKFCVRMFATAEANMNSVERIKYYGHEVEQEGGLSAKRKPPPEDWPATGVVEVKNISMRYRDGPLVLKDVSFTTDATEKVGIAGRTGSGKSSLMAALFRIVDLEEGVIKIDGRDCSLIPLKTLRSKLGIIPQDPVMFSATVRFNLDPFDQHTDQEIWDILESCELKTAIQSLPGQLQETVAESGENFSAGQRQLICIARALLRRPKVLVLDEATASVDNETDARMQVTIREKFKDCTVLTIAHRLHTIVDSDRIMVLENGNLAELDSPQALLSKEGGLFKSLWERHQLSHGQRVPSKMNLAAIAEEAAVNEEQKEEDTEGVVNKEGGGDENDKSG